MSGLNLDQLYFDAAVDAPNIGSILLDSTGTRLTSTLNGGAQSLDVNISNTSISVTQGTSPWVIGDGGGSITVDAVDLDIRDLTHVSDSVKIGDGVDFLAINADGSINVNLTDDSVADDAADTGNPFKVGGKAYSSLSADPVDNGDRFNLAGDIYRRIYVNDSSHMRIKNSAETVTTTAAEIVASPLAGRKELTIQNLSDKKLYIGFDATVTSSNGLLLDKNSSGTYAWGENVDIFMIAATGSADVRVLESA